MGTTSCKITDVCTHTNLPLSSCFKKHVSALIEGATSCKLLLGRFGKGSGRPPVRPQNARGRKWGLSAETLWEPETNQLIRRCWSSFTCLWKQSGGNITSHRFRQPAQDFKRLLFIEVRSNLISDPVSTHAVHRKAALPEKLAFPTLRFEAWV